VICGGTVRRIQVSIAASIALIAGSVVTTVQLPSASAQPLYSCGDLQDRFPNGIARDRKARQSAIAAGYHAPTVNPKAFKVAQKRIKPSMKHVLCAVSRVSQREDAPSQVADPLLASLAAAVASAGASCLVVRREGQMVGEWYWEGRQPSTQTVGFSTMKGVTSTLVGIANAKSLLDVDQRASDFITEWRGTPSSEVTIRQLLTMTSGREVRPGDQLALVVQPNPTSYAISLGQSFDPGSTWRNSDSAVQTLDMVLRRATGKSVITFAQEELFSPLGMKSTTLVWDFSGGANMAFNYRTTCRDLSRLTQLYVQRGVWEGRQLLTADFVASALSPSHASMPGYGFLLRLNTPGAREHNPRLPADAFDFLGQCGQVSRGIPSEGLVLSAMVTAELTEASTCDPEGRRIALLRNLLVMP